MLFIAVAVGKWRRRPSGKRQPRESEECQRDNEAADTNHGGFGVLVCTFAKQGRGLLFERDGHG